MITGDHKETALAIARELGLTDHKNDGLALTGLELMKWMIPSWKTLLKMFLFMQGFLHCIK